MTEGDVVARSPAPRTWESLAGDLRGLGLAAGGTVIVHCSLSAIGWVSGGAEAVILALRSVLTDSGTLVMPAQSGQLSDPAGWVAPPIPAQWHEQVRATMPSFARRTTPTRGMGVVAEQFRTWPGVLRSQHPTASFAALGPEADSIVARQPLDDSFGNESPLARLYELRAGILLIGAGFDSCTALHLAERRAWPDRARVPEGAPLIVDGQRQWVCYEAPELDAGPFSRMGEALLASSSVASGMVGSAVSHLALITQVVDFAVGLWSKDAAPDQSAGSSLEE